MNTRINFMPLPYRRVSVQEVEFSLSEKEIRNFYLGKMAYRRTDFVVLKYKSDIAVIEIKRAEGDALFHEIVALEILATPSTAHFVVDHDVDTANISAVAKKAKELNIASSETLVVEGAYCHVNFLVAPQPLVITVVDIIPPSPPRLVDMTAKLLDSEPELPAIVIENHLIDLNDVMNENPHPEYLFPCKTSGIKKDGNYLDQRPEEKDWLLIGCKRCQEIHQYVYGRQAKRVETCPKELVTDTNKKTILRCCMLENHVEFKDNLALIPWGFERPHLRQALEYLAREEQSETSIEHVVKLENLPG